MKKIIITFFSLFINILASAQPVTKIPFASSLPTPNRFAYTPNGLWLDSVLKTPRYKTIESEYVVATWDTAGNFVKTSFFTEEQKDRLRDLVYENYTASFSISPSFGERGVDNSLSLNYNIASKDDIVYYAEINPGSENVINNVDSGSKSITGLSSKVSVTYTLSVGVVRNGDTLASTNYPFTYSAYTPQYAGAEIDSFLVDNVVDLDNSYLTKYVQSSTSINITISPSGEYVWFISNKSNATIKDGNDFTQSVGDWGDVSAEFWKKTEVLTLADGTTTSTVYYYRSRLPKTLSNFTYKIN